MALRELTELPTMKEPARWANSAASARTAELPAHWRLAQARAPQAVLPQAAMRAARSKARMRGPLAERPRVDPPARAAAKSAARFAGRQLAR
jgi:hypothetical protein